MSDRLTVAVAGANGFIGNRLVEWLVLRDLAAVRPFVRSFGAMARLARFDLDCRVVDATDVIGLGKHLEGCSVLFYCVVQDPRTNLRSAEAAYRGAEAAGVRRLVYLSSAVVHGNAPHAGTHDDSELLVNQQFEYNASKVESERLLRRLRSNGAVEVITLRPSIVYGPRSKWWTAQIASDLLSSKAYLVDRGTGICNTVYVDNLVEAMWLAAMTTVGANRDFIITDGERVTWRDLYESVAKAVGVDLEPIPSIPRAAVVKEVGVSFTGKKNGRWSKRCLQVVKAAARDHLSPGVKQVVRRVLNIARATQSSKLAIESSAARLDWETLSLQCCQHMLPTDKARKLLGYVPRITFAEGSRRSAQWLRFALGWE
jgi:nucleoside-diphosphate-sugar epimerase